MRHRGSKSRFEWSVYSDTKKKPSVLSVVIVSGSSLCTASNHRACVRACVWLNVQEFGAELRAVNSCEVSCCLLSNVPSSVWVVCRAVRATCARRWTCPQRGQLAWRSSTRFQWWGRSDVCAVVDSDSGSLPEEPRRAAGRRAVASPCPSWRCWWHWLRASSNHRPVGSSPRAPVSLQHITTRALMESGQLVCLYSLHIQTTLGYLYHGCRPYFKV